MSPPTGFTGPMEVASSLSLWGQIKESAVPIVAYWAWLVLAYITFVLSLVLTGNSGGDDVMFMVIFGVVTFAAVALGQVLAFLRIRTWTLLVVGGICWTIYFGFLVGASQAVFASEFIGAGAVAVLLIGPIALTGGLWSLETHKAMWSAWLPMVYSTAAALIWIEENGGLGTWKGGEKWAVWDLGALALFLPSVGLFLLYLVSRETHRLAMWRRGPSAPLQPSVGERGVARPRLTFVGFILLSALALCIGVSTAVVAPYLWRTGPPPNDPGPTHEVPGEPDPDMPDVPNPNMDWLTPEMKEMIQKMGEAGKKAGGTICSVLAVALMLLLGALLTYRPLKRLLVMRHLRDPLWEISPAARIEQGWRMVEVALADVGVHPLPGEDAAGLARRAAPVLATLSPVEVHGLAEAAEVADRVRFGLGVGPGDVATMERFSRWVMDTVWERLDDKAQMAAMYRGL